MKKLDVFPEFVLAKENTQIKKNEFPNIEGVYFYKDFLLTVYNNNGIRSVKIENSKSSLDHDDLENIATRFIGLNYKLKKNYTLEEVTDDKN